ncbi:MAG: site-specific DNA-methyltransferase [Oscillospiraceae bacterium]
MDKLKMMSMDNVQMNVEKIQKLFPNAVTEVLRDGKPTLAIDFDVLKQELSAELIGDKEERYQFTWPDKKKSILLANTPISATLRPCKEESVDYDHTQNLYIEGDNLDVLKLLQETYLGKIKMIYIDPPYNTGNDFVYNDDFRVESEEWNEMSGDYDEQGNRLVQNTESNGRFHTDWLNMIYPRLKVAKDLLADDGVIFISIDDHEVDNLKKICDEIFGESNFVANLVWQKKTGAADAVNIATITENIIVYAKELQSLQLRKNMEAHDDNRYKYKDEYFIERGPFYYDNLDRGTLGYHETLDYGIETPDGTLAFPNGRTKQFNDGWRWKWGKEKMAWGLKNGFIELQKAPNKPCGWGVYYKIYLNVDNEGKIIERSSPYKNFIQNILNTHAANEAKRIMGSATLFSNPKPMELLKFMVSLVNDKKATVMDFFSGSATTAHAVMQLNAEDGGSRKFIMVQLPEKCDEKSEAFKAGYGNICEIGKERIRRAGKKIKEENPLTTQDLDIGFRVLKLDSSNMKDVYYKPSDYSQGFLGQLEDNIKADRTPLDLLFQVMLDLGKPLSAKIEEKDIAGNRVFAVDDNDLVACFDSNVTEDVVKTIAQMKPLYAVFRDSSLSSDSVAANFDQIFATYSPNTTRKVL